MRPKKEYAANIVSDPASVLFPHSTSFKCKWCKDSGICHKCLGTGIYRIESIHISIIPLDVGPSLKGSLQFPSLYIPSSSRRCYFCKGTGTCIFCQHEKKGPEDLPIQILSLPSSTQCKELSLTISELKNKLVKELKKVHNRSNV